MRVLIATGSRPDYMRPPLLAAGQVICGPDWPDDIAPDGTVRSLRTPVGTYDLASIAGRLPADQRPDVVVCLVDSAWRSQPRNLARFRCPRVLLIGDTHHLLTPLQSLVRYARAETFDRHILLYDRHHAAFLQAAGVAPLYWLPGLTFPHEDGAVLAARGARRRPQLVFVGQTGPHHARRHALLACLKAARVPVAAQSLPQARALGLYGASLAAFNASLNGDLNLRVFEILSTGAALLTDALAEDSGLGLILREDHEFCAYRDAAGLIDRARHLLTHPAEAAAQGAAGATWFDTHFTAEKRRAAFRGIAFDGRASPLFPLPEPARTFIHFATDPARLSSLLTTYEVLQELHRRQDEVHVQSPTPPPPGWEEACRTLPRCRLAPASPAATPQPPPDLTVVNQAQLRSGPAPAAARLWCWDAAPADVPGLSTHVGAAGLSPVAPHLPFWLSAAPASPAGSAPAAAPVAA